MELAPSEDYSRQSVSNSAVFFIGQQHECVFVLCIRGTAPGAPRHRLYLTEDNIPILCISTRGPIMNR